MMHMRSFADIFGGPERSALDLPVAGLAAAAVAFAAFTIPDALLGNAVEATGLPAVVAAAQPPLGSTARLLLALCGALAAFVVTFALLGWLDRFASRTPALARGDAAPQPEAPRIHRADAHPDAPPRRPISAARDLGEPAPPARPAIAPDVPAVPPVAEVAAEATAESPPAGARVVQPPLSAAASASLGDLMARLERGLAKREGASAMPLSAAEVMPQAAVARPMTAAAKTAPPAPSNDRLQSAIEGLRALSARA